MGFFDCLFILLFFGIPGVTITTIVRRIEARKERTDKNLLAHERRMRQLDMDHEARVLALPAPKRESGE